MKNTERPGNPGRFWFIELFFPTEIIERFFGKQFCGKWVSSGPAFCYADEESGFTSIRFRWLS
ncbi:hypothetical protein [Pedobacter borealis]|uniref:hypothetical protein n=1 Tax=Pedobacter borealis TaxID=475254 RepID=UPI000492F300|nr:hypothetical protein [Pedobacter borealis]